MLNAFLLIATPLLLVFGVYHLLTWFDILRINSRVYWRRVALAAGLSHLLLATGFFAFTYLDFGANRTFLALGMSYPTFLFQHSEFWRLIGVLDTGAMLAILAVFALMDRADVSGPVLLPVAISAIYLIGTLQWYYVGGAIGAALDRFWEGLKTGDDGEEWFR